MQNVTLMCKFIMLCSGARAFRKAFFGQGTGDILFANLSCSSEDTHIDNCTNLSLDDTPDYCQHWQDAGIQCNPLCAEGSVRLFKGSNMNEGIVEVCKNGLWGSICYDPDDPWGAPESRVICRQLGLPYTG